jgi:hypothetical protein
VSGGIFVLHGEDLVAMHSSRRWLLVRREAGVPDSETGGSRWSLDHLFIDQEAVPTLVEVKRSDDTMAPGGDPIRRQPEWRFRLGPVV